MTLTLCPISSLHKLRQEDPVPQPLTRERVLAGERFSFQVAVSCTDPALLRFYPQGPLAEFTRLYRVRDAAMDVPVVGKQPMEDYITHTPGLMPDILVPLEDAPVYIDKHRVTLWVRVDIPRKLAAGEYPLTVVAEISQPGGQTEPSQSCSVSVEVLPVVQPEQTLTYTRWIYLDCIAQAHGVSIFSEDHWQWIRRYIRAAVDMGVNMLLVPVHTPPLDTEVGACRPCVQLVDVEKVGENFYFGFEKFRKYLRIAREEGIRYYEIAHMFSQWGAHSAANIFVTENGKTTCHFGWHTPSDDPEYTRFLRQYLQAITRELEKEGVAERTWFHISDEPEEKTMEHYCRCAALIRENIGSCRTFDALSDYVFYEKGLVEAPVTCIHHIHKFLEKPVKEQWVYYCCIPQTGYPGAFLAMPSPRNRILGYLCYRYDIKGFLHWGLNFYNSCRSHYPIDPYLTTSGDGAYPSGDPFVVYPGREQVYSSIRAQVLYDGIQDIALCRAAEKKVGRQRVLDILDEAAGGRLCFDTYPRGEGYLHTIRNRLMGILVGDA